MTDLENSNVNKLNTYFYMDSNQNILKYKKHCIIVWGCLYIFTGKSFL